MAAVRGASFILFFILSPLGAGIISRSLLKGEKDLPAAWAEGFLLQVAAFSAILHIITITGRSSGLADACMRPFMIFCALAVVGAFILLAVNMVRNKSSLAWGIGSRERIAVFIGVILIFIFATLLLRTPGETIMDSYMDAYKGREDGIGGMAIIYLAINRLIIMSPDRFLRYAVGFFALIAMVICVEELGKSLKLEGKSLRLFTPLVMGLFVITFFSSEYRDFGIYTRLWDPKTMYVALFCPFGFMMMIKISDLLACGIFEDKNKSLRILILAVAGILAGSMLPSGGILLLVAPEAIGVLTGIVRRIRRVRDTVIYTE